MYPSSGLRDNRFRRLRQGFDVIGLVVRIGLLLAVVFAVVYAVVRARRAAAHSAAAAQIQEEIRLLEAGLEDGLYSDGEYQRLASSIRIRCEEQGIEIRGNYEGRVNQLLNSPAGRAYVGYNAADKVRFASELTFQSSEGIPSVLRLGNFARTFMGR